MTEKRRTGGSGRNTGSVPFVLLTAAFSVLRCVLSVFPKIVTTCREDLLNLELAQNIWLRGRLTLYGRPVKGFRILYPLVLSPFYAITDPEVRMTMISVFNALLLSSSMIPAWLLCGKILKNRRDRLTALLLFALMPDLWLSVTCMSECLYIPMAMWGFWFFYRAFEKGRPDSRVTVGLGLWICLLYMSRSGGMDFRTAFDSPQKLLFWLIAGLCLLLHFATASFFFPIAVPAVGRSSLKPAERKLLFLGVIYVVAAAYLTAGSFSLAEDFGRINMRVILRTFSPAAWLFVPLFLASAQDGSIADDKHGLRHPAIRMTASFIILGLLFLRIPQLKSFADSPALQFTVLFERLPAGKILAKAIPAMLILAGGALWITGRRKALALYVTAVLMAMNTVNGILTVKQARVEEAPPAAGLCEQAKELNRFLNAMNANVLMIRTDMTGETSRLIDTFCTGDYYAIEEKEVMSLAAGMPEAGIIRLKEQVAIWDDTGIGAYCRTDIPEGRTTERIDYIVCVGETRRPDSRSLEDVTPDGLNIASVYRNNDPEILDVRGWYTLRQGEPILFTINNPDYLCYPNSGFSHPESGFTWSEGKKTTIRFKPETGQFAFPGLYWSWKVTNGDQHYTVYADNVKIAEGETKGKTMTMIPIPEEIANKDDMIEFRFEFPDARHPENGDTRILGIGFSELSLVEMQQGEV